MDVREVEPGGRQRLDEALDRALHDHDLEVGEAVGDHVARLPAAAEQAVDEPQRERHLDEHRHLGVERLHVEDGEQRVLLGLGHRSAVRELLAAGDGELEAGPQLSREAARGGAAERLVRVLEAADEVARELGRAAEVDLLNARLTGPGVGPRSKGRVGA